MINKTIFTRYTLHGNLLLGFSGFCADHKCQSHLEITADFKHIQDNPEVVSYWVVMLISGKTVWLALDTKSFPSILSISIYTAVADSCICFDTLNIEYDKSNFLPTLKVTKEAPVICMASVFLDYYFMTFKEAWYTFFKKIFCARTQIIFYYCLAMFSSMWHLFVFWRKNYQAKLLEWNKTWGKNDWMPHFPLSLLRKAMASVCAGLWYIGVFLCRL